MARIAVDAMGSDAAPGPEVAGAIAALREAPVEIVLVGDEPRLRRELDRLGAAGEPRLTILHASEVVTVDDAPARVVRAKRGSSMRRAFELVAGGEADAVVSAGSSGAMLGHALLLLGRLPGVERPGIITVFPAPGGRLVLCDMGANVEVKPAMLAQFGVLGACYDRVVHGHVRPRVGLLSNGAEPSKGTELTRAADEILRAAARSPGAELDYAGYIEGSALFHGAIDVVATDGFTGNVALKMTEGVAELVFRLIERALLASPLGRVGGMLMRSALREVKKSIDYAETGGALLAGVNGVVTICHGRSDVTAMKNAIKASERFARTELVRRLGQAIDRSRPVWDRALGRDTDGPPGVGPGDTRPVHAPMGSIRAADGGNDGAQIDTVELRMKTALLFPGQGSQRVGMGRDLARELAAAREVFEEADDALGFAISAICFDGPEDRLVLTEYTQPAILTNSIAVLRTLQREAGLTFDVAAGHSLGEISALVAAGALAFADAVKLVHLRGRAMQEAVPAAQGAMAALMGLDLAAAQALCDEAGQGQVCAPANLNGGGQIVISGHAGAIERAVAAARSRGAKRAVTLQVSAPFHCALMAPAAERLRQALESVTVGPMRVPVVANVDAAPNSDAGRVKDLLVAQVTGAVRWEESIQALAGLGVTVAYELGSGSVLRGLVKRIADSIAVTTIGEPHEIRAFQAQRAS